MRPGLLSLVPPGTTGASDRSVAAGAAGATTDRGPSVALPAPNPPASASPPAGLPPGDPVGGVPADVQAALDAVPPWAATVLGAALQAEREARARRAAVQEAAAVAAAAWRDLPEEIRALAGRRAPGAPRTARVAAEYTRGLADAFSWWALHLPVLRQAHDRLPPDAWTTTLAGYVRVANALVTDEENGGRAMCAAGRRRANVLVETELHTKTKSLAALVRRRPITEDAPPGGAG